MTSLRTARRLAIAFFVINAIAVTFPAVVLLRGPRPFILGIPLAMAWATAWIIAAFFVLLYTDAAHRHAESAARGGER